MILLEAFIDCIYSPSFSCISIRFHADFAFFRSFRHTFFTPFADTPPAFDIYSRLSSLHSHAAASFFDGLFSATPAASLPPALAPPRFSNAGCCRQFQAEHRRFSVFIISIFRHFSFSSFQYFIFIQYFICYRQIFAFFISSFYTSSFR